MAMKLVRIEHRSSVRAPGISFMGASRYRYCARENIEHRMLSLMYYIDNMAGFHGGTHTLRDFNPRRPRLKCDGVHPFSKTMNNLVYSHTRVPNPCLNPWLQINTSNKPTPLASPHPFPSNTDTLSLFRPSCPQNIPRIAAGILSVVRRVSFVCSYYSEMVSMICLQGGRVGIKLPSRVVRSIHCRDMPKIAQKINSPHGGHIAKLSV